MTSEPFSFLAAPAATPAVQGLADDDLADLGYVMNATRLWGYQPASRESISDLQVQSAEAGALTIRQRAVLVAACASALGDSYCSLAWGKRLAEHTSPATAAAVLEGVDGSLDDEGRALARWARLVARDPNGATAADVDALRQVGFDDAQIFAITCFVAARLAFSTVNDALGARPDPELVETVPAEVRGAVTFGRPVAEDGSP